MKYLILLLFSVQCWAFDVVSLRETSITFNNYFKGAYHPIVNNTKLENRYLDKELALNLNIDLLHIFYWNSNIHTLMDNTNGSTSQYRSVGWQYQFGARLTDFLSVYYHHHSQHLIDYTPAVRYYIEDAVGVKINIHSSDTKPGVLW